MDSQAMSTFADVLTLDDMGQCICNHEKQVCSSARMRADNAKLASLTIACCVRIMMKTSIIISQQE